ncbi:MAG: hypothetical protein PHI97_11165 [Desulfobulbus sp.]|nr:hypothetical protein [Desulfobulbus sp.]
MEGDEPVTHGYCPECFATVMTEIQSVVAQREKKETSLTAQSYWSHSQAQEGACV